MATNLTGLFGQLNQGIQKWDGMFDKPINQMSQAAGGMLGSALDADPMSFMNEGAKEREYQKRRGMGLDMNDPAVLLKLSQAAEQAGKPEEAAKLVARADAVKAKQMQDLEAMGEANVADAAKTREKNQARMVASQARVAGKNDLAIAVESGTISPKDAFDILQGAVEDTGQYTLGYGDVRFDQDGVEIARGPEKPETVKDMPVEVVKQITTAVDAQTASEGKARKYGDIAERLESADFEGGVYRSGAEWLKNASGYYDDEKELIREASNIRSSEVVNSLPPGPASDKDVAMALKGAPQDNATAQEWASYVRGLQKLSELDAAYQNVKRQHLRDAGHVGNVPEAWAPMRDRILGSWAESAQQASGDLVFNPETGRVE